MEQSIDYVTASKTLMMTCVLTCAIISIFYALFIIYLGIYGYGNPDPEHAFYIDGLEKPTTTKTLAESLAKDKNIEIHHGYPVDMAFLFRSWFLWGFWSHIIALVIHAIFIPMFIFCHDTFYVQ